MSLADPALPDKIFRIIYLRSLGIHDHSDTPFQPGGLGGKCIQTGDSRIRDREGLRKAQRGGHANPDARERARPDAGREKIQIGQFPPCTFEQKLQLGEQSG